MNNNDARGAEQLGIRFTIGDLVVDRGLARVSRSGEALPMPRRSYELLLALARRAPNVVTHETLMHEVWRGVIVNPDTIAKRVMLLRDALGDDAVEPRYVLGMRGYGYRLIPQVGAAPQANDESPARLAGPAPIAPAIVHRGTLRKTLLAALALGACAWFIALAPSSSPDAQTAAVREAAMANVADRRSHVVAVLPFETLGTDERDVFLGAGIAEMILNRLAAVDSLTVIARYSSFSVEPGGETTDIGRRLGARYLLRGAVQRSGDTVRVTAQLLDTADGRQVHALALDRPVAELFVLQDEVASRIVLALDRTLAVPAPRSDVLEAQLEYLAGLAATARFRVADAEAAIRHFRAAQALDPQLAAAYVGEAKARRQVAFLRGEDIEALAPVVQPLIERALAIDPREPAAYEVRALFASTLADAERDLRRAIELAPNDAASHLALGETVAQDPDRALEARDLLDRAVQLDPLQPRARYVRALHGAQLGEAAEETERRLVEVLRLDPGYTQALTRLGYRRAQRGLHADAIGLVERALRTDPTNSFARQVAIELYFAVGDLAAAAELAASAREGRPERIALALYSGDDRLAGELAWSGIRDAGDVPGASLTSLTETLAAAFVLAVRDRARRTGEHARGIELLEQYGCRRAAPGEPCGEVPSLVATCVIAELKAASGDTAGATALATRILEQSAALASPTARPYAAIMRAKALLVLRRREEALLALQEAHRWPAVGVWSINLEHDAAFDSIRNDPRFAALAARTRRHAEEQRAELSSMRREGRAPLRPALRASSS